MSSKAPGKLMLAGEYAVLIGGPSIVAAVDRYVVAGLGNQDRGYRLIGAEADDALPRITLETCGHPALLENLWVDVSQLYADDGQKMGLGSSAASIVAICRAAGVKKDGLLEVAQDAHRRLQHGAGSGADVAASALGGVLHYQLAHSVLEGWGLWSGAPDYPITQAIELPQDLRVEAIWLGEPASSTELVGRVAAHQNVDSTEAMHSIIASAKQMLAGCMTNDTRLFLKGAQAADKAMEALGAATGAPIIVDAHRELRRALEGTPMVCKPSGAGGGDFSLVFGPADADWSRVTATHGWLSLALG